MRQQFARFLDDRRIPIKCGVCFGRSFSSGVVLRRYIGNRKPLRLAVYAKQRLIAGVGKREKTICALLNRRLCRSEGDERKNEREQEHQPSQSYGLAREKEARNSWTMHKRRLPEANQDCEARFFLLRTDRWASIEFRRRAPGGCVFGLDSRKRHADYVTGARLWRLSIFSCPMTAPTNRRSRILR